MAKKINPIKESSELDLDIDFDDLGLDSFEGGDAEVTKNSKGRNPVMPVAKSFASGAMKGFVREDNVRRIASNALPPGYGTTVNTGYEAVELGKSLYNTAAKELQPAMPTIRKAAGSIASKTQKFLPRKAQEKLQEFADRKDEAQQQTDYDEEAIQGAISEVFGVQMEEQARQREEDRTERQLQAKIVDNRMVETSKIMDAIRANTDRQVAYQDSVLAKFQRRSLEIQLRSMFLQRDMLKVMVAGENRQKIQLADIQKNTALPEYRKTTLHEASMASFRDRLLGNYQQKAVDYVSNFTRNLTKNLTQAVGGAVGSLAQGIESAGSAKEMLDSAESLGMKKSDMIAEQAGGMIVPMLTRLISRPILKATSKHEPTRKLGAKLNYRFSNIAERANDFAQAPDDNMTVMGGLFRMMREVMPRMGIDPTLGHSPLHEADEAAFFDKQTRRSIVEVIPGFLSRIHHEIVKLRTKDNNAERTVYNMSRGEFTGYGTASSDARKTILHPHRMNHGREQVDQWVDSLDEEKKLSPEARAELRRQIAIDSVAGKYFKPSRYMDEDSDTSEMSAASRAEFKKHFGDKFVGEDGKANYDALNKYDSSFRNLKGAIYDPKAAISAYRDAGLREYLADMGMVDRQGDTDRVNYGKFYDELLASRSEDLSPDLDPTPAGPHDPAKRGGAYWDKSVIDRVGRKARVGLHKRTRGMKRGAKRAFNNAKSHVDEVVHVYNNEGKDAAIDLVKLKAGGYYDSVTEQAVTKLEDLKGDLMDRADNVVLSAKDLANGYLAEHPEVQKQLDRAKVNVQKVQDRVADKTRRPRVMARRKMRQAMGRGRGKAKRIMDILTADGSRTLLEGAKIEGGSYMDIATNRIIKSYKDIRGAVRDLDTDEIAMRLQDVRRGLKDEEGNTPAWVNELKTKADYETRKASVMTRRRAQVAGRAAKGQINDLAGKAKQEFDLYVGDGKHPKLEAAAMAAGEYFDQATGAVIRTYNDIKGTVIDAQGKVLLSPKDMAKDLRDQAGQKVNWLKAKLREGVDSAKAAAGKVNMPNLKGAVQVNQMELGGEFGGELLDINRQQLVSLEKIFALLASGQVRVGAIPVNPEDAGPTGIVDRINKWGANIGDSLSSGLGRLRTGIGNGAKWAFKKYTAGAKALVTAPFKAAARVGSAIGGGLGMMQEYLGDIRTKDGRIALTYVKMKNGDYFDKLSKKPVRKYRDITGPVEDRSSQPYREVLSAQEYSEGMYDTNGRKLFRAVGDVFARVAKAAGAIGGGYLSLISAPFRAASWVSNKIKEMNAPQDVYVSGDLSAPRVTVDEMNAGKVFQADRKTKIKKWHEIRGQVFKVVDGTLRQVISLEEFQKGLVDYQGKKLRRGSSLIAGLDRASGGVLGAAGSFAKGYMKFVGGLYAAGGAGLKGIAKGIGRFFGLNGRGGEMTADQATIALLSQIRDLIVERVNPPKKIRKGSWEERKAQKEKERADKEEDQKEEKKEKNSFLGRMFAKMGDKFGSWFGGDEDDEDDDGDGGGGDTNIYNMGGDGDGKKKIDKNDPREKKRRNKRAKQLRKQRAKARRPKGRFGRMFAGAKGLGRRIPGVGKLAAAGSMAGRVAGKIPGRGMIGKVGSKLGRFRPRSLGLGGIATGVAMGLGGDAAINALGGEKTQAGRMASGAVDTAGTAMTAYSLWGMGSSLFGGGAAAAGGTAAAGTAAAGTAAAAGGAGVAGTAGTVAGGGLLMTVGLPVAIGAAVIGGIAYIGHKGWKKYKYGSYEPMRAFRMAQYGIDYKETDQVKMVCDLEQMLEPYVKRTGQGMDIMADKNFDIGEVYKLFDLDDGWFSDNKSERAKFDVWFNHRFKPIFLFWKVNMTALDKSKPINDAEDLSVEQRTQLLKAVNEVNPSAYSVQQGPFDGDMLEVSASQIGDQYKLALNAVEKSKTFWGRTKQKLERVNAGIGSMTFGIFGGDWISNWTEKSRQARELKEINGKATEAAAKTAEAVAKAKSDNRAEASINPKAGLTATAGGISATVGGNAGGIGAGGTGLAATGSSMGARAGMQVGMYLNSAVDNAPEPKKPTGTAKEWSEILMKEAIKAGITDKNELAMFLAQCSHESAHFSALIEGSNYRAAQAAKVFPKYFKSAAEAQAVIDSQGKAGILNRTYGGRMGNTAPGDGFKYRGRGFIQLTGKDNYARFAKASGLDVVNNPDLIATDPRIAAKSAIYWWMSRGGGIREKAAALDLNGVTRLVNGGTNGLSDRAQQLRYYTSQMQGNTEMNNLRANTSTDARAMQAAPGTALTFSGSAGVSAATGGSDGGRAARTISTAPASAGVERESGGFTMAAARPSLNATALPAPVASGADRVGSQETALQKQLAAQTAQAAAQDARSTASRSAGNNQMDAVSSTLNASLEVQKSIDNRLSQVVTLLGNLKVTDLAAAGVSSSQAGATGGKTGGRNLGLPQSGANPDTPIVNMRRNRRAGA